MSRVVAALDNSLAARAVDGAGTGFARLVDAAVDAVHVRDDGDRVARAAAEWAGLELRTLEGGVVEALRETASAPDVEALIMGARRTPASPHTLGSTALSIATTMPKVVVVVPPDAAPRDCISRLLVPLEGTEATSLAPRPVLELAERAHLEIVVLHVYDEASLPAFTDQPQHEEQAWAKEFLARHCPWCAHSARLTVRVGRCEDVLPRVAAEHAVDLVALAWSQQLAHGRARVVRAALAQAKVPVLLIPVASREGG